MELTFTAQDAALLVGLLSSVIVPFAVSFLKRNAWPAWAKVALALVLSGLGGFLTQYAAGNLQSMTSIIAASMAVFIAAQANFASWFQGMHLDDILSPEDPGIPPTE